MARNVSPHQAADPAQEAFQQNRTTLLRYLFGMRHPDGSQITDQEGRRAYVAVVHGPFVNAPRTTDNHTDAATAAGRNGPDGCA
jgi:hypothetical protein